MAKKNKVVISVDSENCKTCGIAFQGDFCHACGQKRIYNRFTLKQSSIWLFSELFNLDHGFFYTSKEIIFRPHLVIKEYLSGTTKKYMHPFRFLFVWVTINSLLTIWLGVFENKEAFQDLGINLEDEKYDGMKMFLEYFQKYMTIIIMLGVPVMAIASAIMYKSKKLFYTEHLIFNSFAYAGTIILGIPLLALIYLPHGLLIQSNVNSIVFILYFAFIFFKFFKENYIESLIKVLLLFVITVIISFLIGIIIGTPAVIFYLKFIKT